MTGTLLKKFCKHLRHGFLCLLFFAAIGCVNRKPSIEEWNLARSALQAARDSEAKRYAPKLYSRARRYMKKAERAYKQREFDNSEEFFRKSRYYSEKAETVSRLKMFKQGEVAP